ncbi:metabotropic glutamate receptor 2-like isoform X1 [Hylaeus anthracinus]|uniref:metabotropic glutamate receptor 2-like isoform X1 n=1 Tax=Hylaeus anthracinus TaxID=313031 RepID=UPI0023B9E734|nr:metabotropic glutamate receptor 2-like isoform X1 [Hylaeus anthracinus]
MKQRNSRGNSGNSGAKLGSSMGKLGNSRSGDSSVIGTGNVEEERAEEWSSLKTGLSGVTGILGNKAKGDTRDPIEGSIGSIEEFLSAKEDETVGGLRVKGFQFSEEADKMTKDVAVVKNGIQNSMNGESKSSEGSKEMRVENLQSVKQEDQRTQVDLTAVVKDSVMDSMNRESKSYKSSKKMRVDNLQSVKQEDQRSQIDLADIVEDNTRDPMDTESESSKSSKKMRVENLQSVKQEDQRSQIDLADIVEDNTRDPMDTESKSSKSSKMMRVENLQSVKQEDQRTQIGPTEIVEDRESKSSIEESLDLKKDEKLGNPRAKDLSPTKQPINRKLHLSAALNKTLNNIMNSQSSTDDLPSPKDNTSLTSKVPQHKFETQTNLPFTKPNNIVNPPIQSSVFTSNLHSLEQRPSDSPTKQRRDSSGFPTKSEVPSSVLGNKAPNVTSTKIESFPFENLGPRASVLDRREFIAQSRATITSTMDEMTSPQTASFDEDVPFETTESGKMDAGASIASTTDMDRLIYLGTGEYRITTAANVSQSGGDNSSHELEYQWPVKHSAVVEGDLVLGGLMMVHEREDRMTCGPVMPQGGVQAVEAMLYTLDWLNEQDIVPGVKIGAHILDDCDKDTYGLEMAVDFIKGSISNIDGAEYHCNKTAVRKVISGVVGAASSVTSIQVANLLRLFRIPQVSFFSTSPELSNKQRFEYFTRTIPSDHYQVKAMVDIVLRMGWSYVSIIYEESNYGIKAFEELEELLGKYDICIAIKEKLVKDSGVAGETAYDNIVLKLLTKPRAKGCIIYASDQEVAELMRAVRRCNATGAFSWIGSDGWSARGLVSNGNEPEVEGTLSVQPQANPIKGFKEYFLNLTVENNRRNPWFVEFWEDHFQCRYPNASLTPYNKRYTKPCTTKERLTAQNTAVEDQLQFVSDAVMAFAYAFRDIHKRLCREHPKNCGHMNPTNGTELLQYLREVEFEGLSGDKFKFDKNGDGPARYNIIHFKQTEPGKYKWVRVGKYLEGELRLNMSEIQFKLGHPQPPDSVCALPCEVGQAKKYVEGERCCWHCFNCTQYQIRHPKDETQCIQCRQGTVPDETHSTCRDIPQEFLRPESGWAIGAMSFSATGMLITSFVCGVFLKHNDTPVVRASGRELSYVLLSGILLCYLVTFALVMKPTDIVCGIQRFAAGFCFTVVYAALLTKTNRISRIFNASKHSAKRPSFISPRSQLIICSGLVSVQILINGVWMIIDPAKAMHHYPTREDNLLVCNSYVDASYMIAFAYPIMLIVVCTVYAVLTRKIPEAFNESKHIGFTMYTTCVIWLAFVPLYFGTGNNVALRITSMSVTISLSASVTIACLFSPKLYIILIRPERNVRQSMMPARYNTTKSSAVTPTNASSMIAPVTLTAATCDQNKTVKKHIINTIDCSTQSEYYELEVKDQKNGKPPATVVSRSTQTCTNNDKDSSAVVAGKDSKENNTTTTKENTTTKQINNNARIGNGPVNQTDVTL